MPPTSSPADHLARLRGALGDAGLDLVSVIALRRLAPALADSIRHAAAFDAGPDRLRAVVIGNRGGRFWERLSDAERDATHPVDTFTVSRVHAAFDALDAGGDSVLVYPGDCGFSLLQLGRACGWGVPSWLGVYIHPDFGTWFAFRAVVVTTVTLPDDVLDEAGDACLRCATRDCLKACPVDAPGPPGSFRLDACSDYRLASDSPCAERCLARAACPVGAEYRYPPDLVAHVYGRSLVSLRRHTGREGEAER